MIKIISSMFLAFAFCIGLVGCDKANNQSITQDNQLIRVGTSPGPYSELFLQAIKPILEKQGYTIKTIEFVNLRQADVALDYGDVDINVDQHTAYYQDFNRNSGSDLIGITKIPTVPAGLYTGKKTALNQVTSGDTVAIPLDPSNAARAYMLLQKAGWITLKNGIDPTKISARDVVENKYGINIIEMDSATIPRALPDLEYAVITGSIVYAAKIDAKKALLREDILEPLILVATVKQTNQNTPWAKAVVAAYHSAAFKQYMKEHNSDNYWFIPEELK
ncbi:hypothetical protein JMI89_08925 [Frischella sp. Ac48]|uniref:MetQ/NlpA family ABC transporter substrate-binding protein n=1 Tax=Frischella sp. Ac48 TaxID=2804531 RepID=UPI001C7D6F18|nr:MetQ/NlpA family ABC transporter substrate-binding protein [Frischella sp. Ac48]MBX4133751.1 hypothetical protein [Frischella sp. Ac48]